MDIRTGTRTHEWQSGPYLLNDPVQGWAGPFLELAILLLGVLGLASLFILIEAGRSRTPWKTWTCTRRFVHRGLLPRDPVALLDDAHRLGLLRVVGPAYQFRHLELRDYLARHATKSSLRR